jgi:alpha-mannosidase
MKNVRRFGFVVFGLLAAIFSGPAQTVRPRDYTAHLIGHAHVDLSWLWRWEETVKDVAVRTFAGTLARMAEMPDLTFAQSQAALYEAIEKSDPALFEAIRVRVREGTWIPVGGMWVEPDLNMADGEALARQLLYGKRYFQEKFGLDVKVGWNPDSFGHNLQLPQMLAKAGVPYYVLGRGVPAGTTAFWWEGKGGARILCYVPPGWYNVSLKDGLRSIIAEAARTSPLKDYLVLYGEGDHGGGPRDSDLALIRSAKRDRAMPRTAFAAPEAYFRLLEKQRPDLAVVRSELNPVFPGCYTTQASTKRDNRRGESLLVEAEKFSALAVAGGFRDYYPERDLDEAWKIILRNQFHDILAGSSIGPVYDETAQFYREAFTRGRRALDFSLETIANGVDTRGEGVPVVVFNSLAWERTEPVTVEIPFAGPFRIVDSRGGDTPYQAVSGGGGSSRNLRRVVFTAEGVPSLGYRTYRLEQVDRDPVFKSTVAAGPEMLENEFFKITLDPKRGWITNLYDKANGREALYGPANVLQAVADEPSSMSAWELGLKDPLASIGEEGAKVEVLESGPVRAVVRVSSVFRGSSFRQEITLHSRMPRLDIRTNLDWRERNVMIKAVFPFRVKADRAEFEIPFGSITRPADGAEAPAIRWIDVSEDDGSYGVSLLNDSRYGFDVRAGTARLSVIRGAVYPDPEADRGLHELTYSLYPHKGTWKEAGSVRRGYELNNPLLPRTVMAHPGTLQAETSFVRVDAANIILSAVKMEAGYNARGLIFRFYETAGQRTDVNVELPWVGEATEADLIERPGKPLGHAGKTLPLSFEPYEIKTIRIVRRDR